MLIPEQHLPFCAFGNRPLDPTLPLIKKSRVYIAEETENAEKLMTPCTRIDEIEKHLAERMNDMVFNPPTGNEPTAPKSFFTDEELADLRALYPTDDFRKCYLQEPMPVSEETLRAAYQIPPLIIDKKDAEVLKADEMMYNGRIVKLTDWGPVKTISNT